MSRINGEKARAAITRRKRTAQRVKDRQALAQTGAKQETKPAAKPAKQKSARSGS